jgi:hypothetical protein
MRPLDDPADLSPEDRFRAVAALLAAGLLRLPPRRPEAQQPIPLAAEKLSHNPPELP